MTNLKNLLVYIIVFGSLSGKAQQMAYPPSVRPDRVLLTWSDDPATTATVSWRTSAEVSESEAEIALAEADPDFDERETDYPATTQRVEYQGRQIAYHQVTFRNLEPGTLYAYRVGAGDHRSEWFQFRTASAEDEPLSFIFMGDAQNRLLAKWSRAIRAAYQDRPQADFILHAGDLINHADEDEEWGEWFEAGSFIHAMVPTLAAVGNHEYIKNEQGEKVAFSRFWNPQFNYPANGPEGMEDQVYYLDIQQMRLVVLNSNKRIDEQAAWLEKVLKENPKKWLLVAFHHPMYSVSRGTVNEGINEHWRPLLEKYRVDLVLQGHDHIYGRSFGTEKNANTHEPVYVVSVSGPKMYDRSEQAHPMDKIVENKQLFQTIHIEEDKLSYVSKSVDGRMVDSFEIIKSSSGRNMLVEKHP